MTNRIIAKVLFLAASMFSALTLSAQTFSVSYDRVPLEKIFADIESKTQYTFIYQQSTINGLEPVSCKLENADIQTILDDICGKSGLGYNIIKKTVVIKPAEKTSSAFTCKGIVTDRSGAPLPAVTVLVKGTQTGTSTSSDGRFSLPGLQAGSTLVFTCLGMQDVERKAVGGELQVEMTEDASMLEDVVVIAYGTAKKTDLTGSVANVKMADIETPAALSVDNALQGRIAGAEFMTTDGAPGSTTSIRIRGTRSITASNEPLIIVDGVMDAIHDLNDINTEDIASISVLKDASSTAIYGSQGANGVIIITTKNGTSGLNKPNITFKATVGMSELPSKLDIMDGTEFAKYRNDLSLFSTDNSLTSRSPLSEYTYSDPYSIGEGTDWIGLITRKALTQNYALSVSCKGEKTSMYSSFSWNDTDGIILGSGQKKFNGRIKIDRQFFKWLKVGYNGTYTLRYTDEANTSIGGTSIRNAAQYLAPVIDPESNFNPFYVTGMKINTPLALARQNTYQNKRHSTNHSFMFTITPIKGLEINSSLSYFMYQRHTYRYYPGTLPMKTRDEGGEALRQEQDNSKFSSETTVKYGLQKKGHSFEVLAGFSAYRYFDNSLSVSGSGYMDDSVKWNNMNAVFDKETYEVTSSYTEKTKMSVFARANYNYKSRYYITLTGRFDGASNFAANHKWGFFPSGAVRWNIANEPFLKDVKWIDDLSLRASAGVTGNDAISAYRSYAVNSTTTEGYLFEGSQPVATYRSRLAAPDLTWEKTAMYNIALDWSMFDSRVSLTLEGYWSRTTDLLLTAQVASQTGYSTRYGNIGETTNKGVEFTLDTKNIVKKNFSWSTSLTLSHNAQMVENVGSEEYVSVLNAPSGYMMYGYRAGYPLNALWGFKYGGTWKNTSEMDRNDITRQYAESSYTAIKENKLGNARYCDIDHDGTLGQNDLIYLGSADPYLYGGFQNSFYIYGLKLGVYFAYSLGGKIYNYSELYMAGSAYTNQYRYMKNAWHPVRNPNSDIPKAGGKPDAAMPSDFMVHDASYLRFKTLSLAYTFDFSKKVKWIKDLTLSAVAENIFLWKKYNGFDPDVSSEGTSSTLRRADIGAYPKPRTYTMSVQIKF